MQYAEQGRARRNAAQRGEELRKAALAAAEDFDARPQARGKRSAPPAQQFAADIDGGDSSDQEEADGGRRRGAALTPEEREAKRLRRLMRNRASAQQARERKRDWMAGIEERASTLESRVADLTSTVNALERTNWTLRSLIKTATSSASAATRSEEPVVLMVRAPPPMSWAAPAVMAGGAA